jgi:putative SOS response-associated peptidase YedK
MCNYLGCKISRADYIRLKGIEKEIRNLQLNRPLQTGFDYKDWPAVIPSPDGKDFSVKMVHWEYIPEFIHDELELRESRIMKTWLQARSENLFVNDHGKLSMWRDGAMQGRCLVIASWFYEWRHLPKMGKRGNPIKQTEAFPYLVTLKELPDEYFFMAGIYRHWENRSRGLSADTMAIVTTEANQLMRTVHNTKMRMPTILPKDLAEEWITPGLSQARIREIASYQMPTEKMIAWPVENFLKNAPADPTREFQYDNLPAL